MKGQRAFPLELVNVGMMALLDSLLIIVVPAPTKGYKKPFLSKFKVSPEGPWGFFMSFTVQCLCYEPVATPLAPFSFDLFCLAFAWNDHGGG
jgi:hypothetical protein